MKKIVFIILILIPCFAFAEDLSLDFGVVNFNLDNKIMEDGSISNIVLGLKYKNNWGGEVRGQFEKTAKNEESDGSIFADSLIATNKTVYKVFLLPLQYRSTEKNNSQWRAGAGLYYEYQKTNEKGFYDIPWIESEVGARVFSYTDDLTKHLLGPVADVGLKYNTEYFKINLSGSIIPVYFLTSSEEQRMLPLFDTVKHSQKTFGSPYLYLGLDTILFDYLCLAVNYNYMKLGYEVIRFDDDFSPIFQTSTVVDQSIMLEASLLIPFKNVGFGLQIGYGYMINIYRQDSDDPIKKNKNYFIFSGRFLN